MVSTIIEQTPYFGACFALVLAGAFLAAGHRWRRVSAVLIAALALGVPAISPEVALARFFLAISAAISLLRVVELARHPHPVGTFKRLWHVVGIIDVLRARRVPRHFNRAAAARALALSVLGALAAYAVYHAPQHHGPVAFYAVRWGAGAVVSYVGLDIMLSSVVVGYGLVGIVAPPMHRDPILSCSVAEFWGQRWNQIVHRYLKRWVFLPVARRGQSFLGIAAAFIASAILHYYIALVSVGQLLALSMAAFFVVQIVLVGAEKHWRIARWPRPAARIWTIGSLLVTVPLFMEAALPVLGL